MNFNSNLSNNIITEYKFDVDLKPNLNYWANSPVKVEENLTDLKLNKPFQIIPNEIVLNKMNNFINSHPYKLDYKVNDKNLDLNILCNFINENYIDELDSTHKFLYSVDLLEYYTSDSLVISFYSKQNEFHKSKMIGLIIGKKSNLFINNFEFTCADANFLILNPKVRNKNLAPLIISILTKELIINYSIAIAHYTINNPIKAPHYCLKYYYHRMINIDKLFETKFISSDISSINDYKQLYNNFKNYLPNQNILYMNKINTKEVSNELIDLIYQNINSYAKKKYMIYEYRTKEQIKKMFNCESFHHFFLLELNHEKNKNIIKNYMCINELKTLNTENNKYYLNGYIYTGFYSDSVNIVIEKISEYIYSNNILDTLTWNDFFDVENSCTLAIKGSGFLKYYLYNIQTSEIPNELNGLVTL